MEWFWISLFIFIAILIIIFSPVKDSCDSVCNTDYSSGSCIDMKSSESCEEKFGFTTYGLDECSQKTPGGYKRVCCCK